MKLFHKLLLGFLIVALMSWVTGFFAVNHSKEVLREAFKDNSEFLAMELLPQGKGIGLGLSISYGIIKNHNGDILVQSELEKGSKFTVLIPATVSKGET